MWGKEEGEEGGRGGRRWEGKGEGGGRGWILQDIEYLGRDLRLAAGGRVTGGCILGARLLHHPPVVVEDRECPSAWRAVLVGLYGGSTGAVAKTGISSYQIMAATVERERDRRRRDQCAERADVLFVHDDRQISSAQAHVHPILLVGGGLAGVGGMEDVLARAVSL